MSDDNRFVGGHRPAPPTTPEVGAPSDRWAGLVLRAANGERDALAALYDGTSPLVYGLALRILQDPGAAEEVASDVYLQVWRQAERFDPRRGAALTWLLTVARSRAIDRVRARRSALRESEPLEQALTFVSPDPEPDVASGTAERRRLVQRALAGLGPEQRRTIELAYFAGLSHTEIAAQLGEPLGTIKTRIRLAMTKLRAALEPYERDAP